MVATLERCPNLDSMLAMNGTAIVDSSLATWRLALCWLQAVVTPLVVVTALPTSLLTMCLMPSVSISVKARLFYVTLTAYNLLSLLISHVMNNFVDNTLHFLSNGTVYFYLESLSPMACKFSRFVDGVGEGGCSYTLALFALERYIVIHRSPGKKRPEFTTKWSIVSLGLLNVFIVGLNSSAYFIYDRKPDDKINPYCSPQSSWMVVATVFLLNTIVPNCALVCMTAMVFHSVRQRAARLHNLCATSSLSTRTRTTTAILLVISTIHCTVYVPASVTYVLYTMVIRFDSQTGQTLRVLSNCISTFLGLLCTVDFLVFICKIRHFRLRVLATLTCSCKHNTEADAHK